MSFIINMAELTGEQFLKCLEKAEYWEPGMSVDEDTLYKAVALFTLEFQDTEETVILIDEIQESAKVYNLIRIFSREFSSYVIVTGSHLGRILSKDFFFLVGDLDTLKMETSINYYDYLGFTGNHAKEILRVNANRYDTISRDQTILLRAWKNDDFKVFTRYSRCRYQ